MSSNDPIARILQFFDCVGFRNIEPFAEFIARQAMCREIPRDVTRIAEYLGLAIVTGPGPSAAVRGLGFRDGDGRGIIYVNDLLPHSARRFTIAHEIFEIIGRHREFPSPELLRREIHQLADLFAAALLMPRDAVIREARRPPGLSSEQFIAALSDRFAVSRAAMTIRLRELGLSANDRASCPRCPRPRWRL